MPLPFIHVSCGFAPADASPGAKQALFGAVAWDEELSTGVTSTSRAPDAGNGQRPVFRITAEADRWLTIAATPADPASAGRRILFKISEGTQQDIYVLPGDRIRGVAAV